MSTNESDLINNLVEQFSHLIRAGQPVDIEQFLAHHTAEADRLRPILHALDMVERAALQSLTQADASPAILPTQSHQVPTTFGDFEVVRELGRGGMGIVYVARQKSLKRLVALKVLPALGSQAEKHRQRFRREAESVAQLHHTNIVPVFGIGEQDGYLFYAMQLIDGVPLNQLIDWLASTSAQPRTTLSPKVTSNPTTHLTPAEAAELLFRPDSKSSQPQFQATTEPTLSKSQTQVANTADITTPSPPGSANPTALFSDDRSITSAHSPTFITTNSDIQTVIKSRSNVAKHQTELSLQYYRNIAKLVASAANALQHAHQQGILHRDIKPGNLLLDRDGILWITDFGLARSKDIASVTQTGEIVGTLRYMAPEQFHGQADQRTDIYSLGLTLFELLTLRPAVEFAHGKLSFHSAGSLTTQPNFGITNIPRDLQTICLKACSQEANQRFQHAKDLEEDIRRFLEDRPILARRSSLLERFSRWARRNPALAGLLTLTATLLMLIAIQQAISNQEKQANLLKIKEQYNRAEENVKLKSAALENAHQENARAEKNLQLALEAFDEVVSNITSRGVSMNSITEIDSETDLASFADAELSIADEKLLESLLTFFDKFAAENSADLKLQSASASRRVGDIQLQLGRLAEAEKSYLNAIDFYQSATPDPNSFENELAQINIYSQLVTTFARQGNMAKAFQSHQKARQLIESSPELKKSQEGRFALASLLNNIASFGLRFAADVRPRPRAPQSFPFRANPQPENNLPPPIAVAQAMRVSREIEINREARQLLESLIEEDSGEKAYQIALAQNYRDEVRIARITRDMPKGETALAKAVNILEKLLKENPDSLLIQFQLAETLGTQLSGRPADYERLIRALEICDSLISSQPNIPEYRALRGSLLTRQAIFMVNSGRKEKGTEVAREALDYQRSLAEQFPNILVYQITYAQSLQTYASFLVQTGNRTEALETLELAIDFAEKLRLKQRQPTMLQNLLLRLTDLRNQINKQPMTE